MKYSILILTLLMFCITGRSQVASGREDRAYWISILSQVADPLLNNMSKGELRNNMYNPQIHPFVFSKRNVRLWRGVPKTKRSIFEKIQMPFKQLSKSL